VGIRSGEPRGVGCSSGLIDRDVGGSLCSRLNSIAICRGDSCHFPVLGEGCASFQDGPSSRTNSSCFSNRGLIRKSMGFDEDALGSEGSSSNDSSFRFPITSDGWNSSHSGGVGLSLDNILESGCLGNRGWV